MERQEESYSSERTLNGVISISMPQATLKLKKKCKTDKLLRIVWRMTSSPDRVWPTVTYVHVLSVTKLAKMTKSCLWVCEQNSCRKPYEQRSLLESIQHDPGSGSCRATIQVDVEEDKTLAGRSVQAQRSALPVYKLLFPVDFVDNGDDGDGCSDDSSDNALEDEEPDETGIRAQ